MEREPTPEKEEEEQDEGLSLSIELPRCNISLGKELYFVKLPNFLSVDTKPFDSNFYEDISSDEDEIHDEEGRARLKLKVLICILLIWVYLLCVSLWRIEPFRNHSSEAITLTP